MSDSGVTVHPDALLAAAEIIANNVEELISNMRPPLSSPGRLQAGLFLTIAEQLEAALLLARVGAVTHSAVHVRSMVEALLAFKLLGKDGSYVQQMKFQQLKGQKKILEGIVNDPDIPDIAKDQIRPAFDDCLKDYQELYDEGLRARQISENFGHADLAHLAAPYSFLCGFSHNDIAIIAARHQGDDGLIYKASPQPEIAISVLAVALIVMMEAVAGIEQIALFPDDLFPRVVPAMLATWKLGIDASGAPLDEVIASAMSERQPKP